MAVNNDSKFPSLDLVKFGQSLDTSNLGSLQQPVSPQQRIFGGNAADSFKLGSSIFGQTSSTTAVAPTPASTKGARFFSINRDPNWHYTTLELSNQGRIIAVNHPILTRHAQGPRPPAQLVVDEIAQNNPHLKPGTAEFKHQVEVVSWMRALGYTDLDNKGSFERYPSESWKQAADRWASHELERLVEIGIISESDLRENEPPFKTIQRLKNEAIQDAQNEGTGGDDLETYAKGKINSEIFEALEESYALRLEMGRTNPNGTHVDFDLVNCAKHGHVFKDVGQVQVELPEDEESLLASKDMEGEQELVVAANPPGSSTTSAREEQIVQEQKDGKRKARFLQLANMRVPVLQRQIMTELLFKRTTRNQEHIRADYRGPEIAPWNEPSGRGEPKDV